MRKTNTTCSPPYAETKSKEKLGMNINGDCLVATGQMRKGSNGGEICDQNIL
jgi:hypothetical protein